MSTVPTLSGALTGDPRAGPSNPTGGRGKAPQTKPHHSSRQNTRMDSKVRADLNTAESHGARIDPHERNDTLRNRSYDRHDDRSRSRSTSDGQSSAASRDKRYRSRRDQGDRNHRGSQHSGFRSKSEILRTTPIKVEVSQERQAFVRRGMYVAGVKPSRNGWNKEGPDAWRFIRESKVLRAVKDHIGRNI